jgi:arylsulfatase A-like enzyme
MGTFRAAATAGLLIGAIAGAVDGLIAAAGIDSSIFYLRARILGLWPAIETAPRAWDGPWGLLGCIATSMLAYAVLAYVALLLLAVPAHPFLRGSPLPKRFRIFVGIALGVWLAAEVFWWSRPLVFPGSPATSPKRLLPLLACAGLGFAGGWVLRRLVTRIGLRDDGKMRRLAVLALAVAFAGGALFLVTDTRRASTIGVIGERTRQRPNVLVFIVDALRQDRLGCYGDDVVKTPHIDRLAKEGVLFENAYVQAPFTWTSFGSFLTGKYPRRHGLVKMAADVSMKPNVTLASWLKQAGLREGGHLESEDYLTAAFLTGTVSHGSGLTQGFDAYFEAILGHDLVDVHSQWSRFRSVLLPWLIRSKLAQRFDHHIVATKATRWLDEHAEDRWCALVHYYSTHTPYDPDEEYRRMYVDPDYTGPVRTFTADHRQAIESGAVLSAADAEQIRALYHGGVSMADAMIGEVVAKLEEKGLLDRTIVVVTSDHGEELGDHGLWEHNFMYETNLRIPLLIRYPRALPAGVRVEAPVDSIDLLPTLCDLLGLEVPRDDESGERGIVDGRSLVPLVRGELASVREYSFAENGPFLSIRGDGWKLVVRRPALEDGGWEKALSGEIGQSQLYDLRNDPDEKTNVFAGESERAHALYDQLLEWSRSMPIPVYSVEESARDIEDQEVMKQLGYGGDIGTDAEEDGGAKE